MKILSSKQIKVLDQYTIEHEPVVSLFLMERAAKAFVDWFVENFPDKKRKVFVLAGPGNNGGDGLAIARMLAHEFYEISAYWLHDSKTSNDCVENYKRLKMFGACPIVELAPPFHLPTIPAGAIVIDALFGNGLDRPLSGDWAAVVEQVNHLAVTRVSVDMPSGMLADEPTLGVSILADHTFSFEMPKLGFLFAENQDRVGRWDLGSIQLHPDFIRKADCTWHLVDEAMVRPLLHVRHRNDHKGVFGHALLVAGGYGKVGAAILSARACMRSGAGLLTVHAPKCANEILQIAFPEAMVSVDEHQFAVSVIREDLDKYSAIGIGPGLGTNELTAHALEFLLTEAHAPLVIDADALNLLALHPDLLRMVPKRSILTPHPKEFDRLFGPSADSWARHGLLRQKAEELGIYIVLKGGYTATASPEGHCYFNNTGNPGMATGGSGDVLTGLLTGLLAQGYPPFDACLLGVYLHGTAGDLAMRNLQQEALLASDITDHLGKAFIQLKHCA